MMKKIKILAVCGTRPDTIKTAPLVKELLSHSEVELILAVTGQHREMLEQVLRAFELTPDYDLKIMTAGQSLSAITTKVLLGLEKIIDERKPDLVIAQGDTTTTFAASLAAFYAKIPFGHVEAGLRTDNKYDPFPEEINRRLTGIISELHFAPTEKAKANLLREHVPEKDITVTGNTGIDALLSIAGKPMTFDDPKIDEAFSHPRTVLMTAHRRENWGGPMLDICRAAREIVSRNQDVSILFSMHKNPVVRDVVKAELEGVERIYLIEPPDYLPFVHIMKKSYLILSDSGGVQEEAPSLGVPVLVMRKTTERPEGVEAGVAKLVGTDPDNVMRYVQLLLDDRAEYDKMSRVENPYGDGKASERIWAAIKEKFEE